MPDQTQKEDAQANPPKDGQDSQPAQQMATPAPQLDWEKRYKESTKEFQNLKSQWDADKARISTLEQVQEKWDKAEPILQKIANNQRILEVIDEEEGKTLTPQAPMQIIEPLLEDKLQKRIGPRHGTASYSSSTPTRPGSIWMTSSVPEFDNKFD